MKKKNHGLKLLTSKHFGSRIQTRIDSFAQEIREYNNEELADFLFHIEEYLLDQAQIQENNGEDHSTAMQAAFRIAEGRFWIGQLE
jgi:hypothetical protein